MKNKYKAAFLLIIISTFVLNLIAGAEESLEVNRFKDKIVFVGTNAVLPQDLVEGFYIGFEAALKRAISPAKTSKILVKSFDFSRNQIVAKKLVKNAIDGGAMAIVGLSSTHEALLAGPDCVAGKILCLSSGASYTGGKAYQGFLYSIMPSLDEDIHLLYSLIVNRFPNQEGVIIRNPRAAYSSQFSNILLSNVSQKRLFNVLDMDKDLKISSDDIKKLVSAKFIIFTAFPFESANVLDQLKQAKIEAELFANSSWDAKSFLILRKELSNSKGSIVLPVVWLPGSKEAEDFEKVAREIISVEPPTEVAAGYDAGLAMGQILLKSNKWERGSILATVSKDICVEKSSIGRLCLSPKGGNALNRKRIWGRLKSTGFEEVNLNDLMRPVQ
jgi:ABC-type branched-subunit amino acid transport system substrate-binding protein